MSPVAVVALLVVASVTVVVAGCVALVERERRLLGASTRRVGRAADRARSSLTGPG
jgi:signal transduction histidine kinase